VAFVLVVRRVNRLVDDIEPDDAARPSTTAWLTAAMSLRRGSGIEGASTGGGELLAGPRAGDRVAGRDPDDADR
jgi:hypothetical protein